MAADAKLIMEMLVPMSQSGDPYWTMKPREWGQVILLWHVRHSGAVTLPDFYEVVSSIYADPARWEAITEDMRAFPNAEVRRVAGEMADKQKHAKTEFSGVLGSLFAALSFIGDEALKNCLEGGDFSLDVLTSDTRPVQKIASEMQSLDLDFPHFAGALEVQVKPIRVLD